MFFNSRGPEPDELLPRDDVPPAGRRRPQPLLVPRLEEDRLGPEALEDGGVPVAAYRDLRIKVEMYYGLIRTSIFMPFIVI